MKSFYRLVVMTILLIATQMVYAYVPAEILRKAQQGNMHAQMAAGGLYAQDGNASQAAYWYKKAAKQGNVTAMSILGGLYINGQGVPKNYQIALHYLRKAEKHNSAGAKDILGTAYQYGYGVTVNLSRAHNLYLASAKQDYSPALFHLGQMYYFGDGVEKDIAKAVAYYKQSANLGYGLAQYKLGGYYGSIGDKTSGMLPKVYAWTVVAIKNGQADTENLMPKFRELQSEWPYCNALGGILVSQKYATGQAGLKRSTSQAAQWLHKAYHIDPHVAPVQLALAQANLHGWGGFGSSASAFVLTKKAAQQPYAPAQQYLAHLFKNGIGTQQNKTTAAAWSLLANYTYTHPDKKYWAHYKAPCRPDYARFGNLNKTTAKAQLAALKAELSQPQWQHAQQLFHKLLKKQQALKAPKMKVTLH